jgi:virginiamycin A acetyltransferase
MNIISSSARISEFVDIETSMKGSKVIVGERTMIDSFVKIKFSGGLSDVVIGDDCSINSGTVIYSGNGIKIGNDVLIAANCTLAPVNHAYSKKDVKIVHQRFLQSKGGIVIEDDVWIGANCVLLDGTFIGKGAVIGAGSIVKGKFESYGIYKGSPLAKIGERK